MLKMAQKDIRLMLLLKSGNFEPRNNNNDNMSNIETTDVSEDPYKDFGEEINISSDDLPF